MKFSHRILNWAHRDPVCKKSISKNRKSILTILGINIFLLHSSLLAASEPPPRLILLLVIDQFRSDYLTRFRSKFLPAQRSNSMLGGFSYLMSEGAYYPQAQYDILQSMTAPGHATILSGSYPYQAGIPINTWFDTNLKKTIYCTDDIDSPVIGAEKTPLSQGVSPKYLNASTVGDELKNAGFPSRVVTIALKDRAAVLMGGHRADIALWFDSTQTQWTTSSYYLPALKLPTWVELMNSSLPPEFKKPGANMTSLGVTVTEEAAEQALAAYQLGNSTQTDLLAVSFSSHDMLGHKYGPNDPHMEEITRVEDMAISKLINKVQAQIPGGLKNVLIVFTADHGVAPSPEWSKANKNLGGRIDEISIASELSQLLKDKFGQPSNGDWVLNVTTFNFYLNKKALQEKKLEKSIVEAEAKRFLLKNPGTAFVLTSSEYEEGKLPPGMFGRQALHTYYPGRSGDLILIPKPFYINGVPSEGTPTSHLTGYSYDRTVPIILVGKKIKKGEYSQKAEVIDIAPTLAFLTGTIPPSSSEGRVLTEALQIPKSTPSKN